jgi:uridine kinase
MEREKGSIHAGPDQRITPCYRKYIANTVYIIAVAGPSCAGKTELANSLARALACPVLQLDCYYRDLAGMSMEERSRVNFDAPPALDHELLTDHVRRISQGHEIARPIYDFKTHARVPATELFKAADFVIVEGLFALYWKDLRDLALTKVFVDAPDCVCLARREYRDIRERGRTRESVLAQFTETVQPMAELYVRPTHAFADLVLSGEQPLEESTAAVLEHVRSVSGRSPISRSPRVQAQHR